MDLEIDNLTVFLLALLLGLLVYHRLFAQPQPLVHPLLLGKQSEPSPVRKEGETGVYRSWATGHGTPLTVRPANAVKIVPDVVQAPKAVSAAVPRCILDTSASLPLFLRGCGVADLQLTDEALTEILHLIPLGLKALFPALASAKGDEAAPILILLPPSPSTALPLLLLYLAALPTSPLIVLPSPVLVTPALEANYHPRPALVVVHASIAEDVLEQLVDDGDGSAGLLIVGDEKKEKEPWARKASERGMNVKWWEDMWTAAEAVETKSGLPPLQASYSDVHSYFYDLPKGPEDSPAVVKVTHLNVTAGLAGLMSLFPADKRPSAAHGDVVASAVRLDCPLGMTIALASLWSGAGFRLIGNPSPDWPSEQDHIAELEHVAQTDQGLPLPTIIFLTPGHHEALVDKLQDAFVVHPFGSILARQSIQSLRSGHIGRTSYADKYIGAPIRQKVLGGLAGDKLRGIVVVGDAPAEHSLGLSHVLLSLPITRLHPSLYSTGPVFVSHFYDVQSPAQGSTLARLKEKIGEVSGTSRAHVGPPASNVEVHLKGNEAILGSAHESGGEPLFGEVFIRGPAVLERVDQPAVGPEGWVDIGDQAQVQTNGTFVITSKKH